MGRRVWALVGKELREHWLVLVLLLPVLGLGLGLVTLASLAGERSLTIVEAGLSYVITFVPLTALALGHRLVVVEYHGRTQLWVESLPVRRREMVGVKFVLGLALLLGITVGALLWSALLATRTEPVDGRFLSIILVRAGAFTWCLWSFFFGMAFTGRYRLPIYLGISILLLILSFTTDLELRHFGPFELVSSQTFSTERDDFPVHALGVTAGVAAGWMAVALALSTIREGSVAEVLARPMSQKEKVLIGVLVIAGLIAATHLEERAQKAPFAFTDTAVLRGEEVEVLYVTPDARESAEALLAVVEADHAALAALLPRAKLPVVRVALRATLDARTFETAKLEENDGVLVRANFRRAAGAPADDDELRALRAHLVREMLQRAMEGRGTFEPKRWVHDAFSRWFVERGRGAPAAPLDATTSRPLLRALWATRGRPVTADDLRRWDVRREQLGELVAEGVAFSGLWALEREQGPGAVLALARAWFDREATKDVREWLHERANPAPELVARATGLTLDALLARWDARLDEARAAPAVRAVLDGLPDGAGALSVEQAEGDLRAIVYRFDFTRPPAPGTLCALVHCALGPYDVELEPHELLREEHAWGGGGDRRLAGRYGPGSRAFLALEVEVEALGASVRLAAERREVP